jgi:hypothetical protein
MADAGNGEPVSTTWSTTPMRLRAAALAIAAALRFGAGTPLAKRLSS